MPWNCLCSSDKERHKLEISAPILNRESNAKIIQNPANDVHSKKINSPFQRNANQAAIASNNNFHDESKLHIKSSGKQRQRSKKIVRNSKNSHAKFQSGEQQSTNPSNSLNFVNKTIDLNGNASLNERHELEPQDEDSNYSQLVFERKINKPNELSSTNILSTNNLQTPATSVAASYLAQCQDSNTGHYDRLPFDKSSSSKTEYCFQRSNGNNECVINSDQQRQAPQIQTHVPDQPEYQSKLDRTATGVVISNGDTIPFIDEEDVVSIVEKYGTHLQIKEANGNDYATTTRIITLHPKNIGSSQTIQRGKLLHRAQLSNMALRKPRGGGEIVVIDSNANLQADSRSMSTTDSFLSNKNSQHGRVAVAGVHNFFSWNPAKGKLCQVCHASALNSVVRCRCCELVCHLWCVPKIMVSGFCIILLYDFSRDSEQK